MNRSKSSFSFKLGLLRARSYVISRLQVLSEIFFNQIDEQESL